MIEALIGLTILIFSAILHEIAHGYVADRLGDPTARLMGRLTLDPRKHIDPFMTILLPLMLLLAGSPVIFGAAKPVPVDPFNLKEGRKDLALVALSGPLTNIIIALIASLSIHALVTLALSGVFFSVLADFFYLVLTYNLLLAIFNLLPIPPLDGSKVFSLILPEKQAAAFLSLGRFGTIILLILFVFPLGNFSLIRIVYSLLLFTRGLLLP